MTRYLFLGLDLALVGFSLWVHDRFRVCLAARLGDPEAAARQRSADHPCARVDWIGSLLLPLFLLFRNLPALGWARPLDVDPDRLRRPRLYGLLIALAGPAANLLLALTGIAVVRGLQGVGAFPPPPWGNALLGFCLANANLAAFGLLPIPPLSGAAAVEPFLDGDALTALEEIKPYGFLLLLVGAYFNFFDFITQPVSGLVRSVIGF